MAATSSSLEKQFYEDLTCSICLELFNKPKVLPCGHIFCQDCLQDLVGRKKPFKCPNCRRQVKLPPQGAACLPDGHVLASLCGRLQSQATLDPEGTREQPQSGNRCSFHPIMELKLYCKQCQMPICEQCLEEAHDDHRTTTIKKAARERRSAVQALITEGRNILETYCSFIRDLQETEKTLSEQRQETKKTIIKTCNKLLAKVEDEHQKNLGRIQTERDRVLADVNDLSAACNQAEQELEKKGVEFLSQENLLAEVVGKYRGKPAPTPVQVQPAVFQPTDISAQVLGCVVVDETPPSRTIQTEPESSNDAVRAIGHHQEHEALQPTDILWPVLEHVMAQSLPSTPIPEAPVSSDDTASGKGQHHGNQEQAVTQPKDTPASRPRRTKKRSAPSGPIPAEPAAGNQAGRGTGHHHGNKMENIIPPDYVQEMSDALFNMFPMTVTQAIPTFSSHAPRGTGQHHGNQRQKKHQPQMVTFGGEGPEPGHFYEAVGVTVSDEGNIFVADFRNQRIQVFTLQGTFANQFMAVADAYDMSPLDIATDGDGNLWVVGYGIQSYFATHHDKEGRVLRRITIQNRRVARGVAVDTRRNHILITSVHKTRYRDIGEVLVFRPDGKLVRTVVHQKGMKYPWYIAVDGEGNILVSDCKNHTVYVYNEDGQFLFKFGGEGSGEGQLKQPCGICTDKAGNIIVADPGNSRVEMFDKTGKFLKHITTDIERPQAVAMATQGQLVVTDAVNNTVSIFLPC